MVTYESMLLDFIKDKFGHSIGETLIQSEMRLYNIRSLSQLSQKEQMAFAERFISKKFSGFMAPEDVRTKILQLNLQYCAAKATEKISARLNQRTVIEPFDIKMDSAYGLISGLKTLAASSFCFPIHISDALNADVLFLVKNNDAMEIARLMSAATGKPASDDPKDESNRVLVEDFITLIVPTILESISNFLGSNISLETMHTSVTTPEQVEKFVMNGSSAENVRKAFLSEIPLVLNEKKLSLTVAMLMTP